MEETRIDRWYWTGKFPAWVREALLVGTLLLAAWAIRQTVYVLLFTDSIGYLSFARNILSGIHHGDGITLARYMYPPLYPHLIAAFSLGSPDLFNLVQTGRQISIWAGAFTLLPLYLLSRRMIDIKAAAASSFIMVLTPELLYYSGAVLTESTATFLITAAILLFWWLMEDTGKRQKIHFAALGAVLGLAFLTRHAAIGFLLLFIVWLLADRFSKKRPAEGGTSAWTATLAAALVVAGFLVAVSPQIFYIRSETGRWSLTGNFMLAPLKAAEHAGTDTRYTPKREAVNSLTPDGKSYLFEATETGQGSNFLSLVRHPGKFLHAYFLTVTGGLVQDTRDLPYPSLILILALAGIFHLLHERRIRTLFFILWMCGGFYLFLGLFHNMRDRYMFPVLPMLLLLAGAGVSFILEWASKRAAKAKLSVNIELPVAVAIAVAIFASLFQASTNLVEDVNTKYDMVYYRAMHDELEPLIEPGFYVFDRLPHRPFFAGARRAMVPYDSIERVVEFGRVKGVRYWIVSDDYVKRFRPMFTPLLKEPERYSDDLKVLAVYGASGTMKTIIFEILP